MALIDLKDLTSVEKAKEAIVDISDEVSDNLLDALLDKRIEAGRKAKNLREEESKTK